MARSKYRMTDAAAKRMAAALQEAWQERQHVTIAQIQKTLRDEDFWGANKANYIKDLVQWMIENGFENFSRMITDEFIREYYEQRDGIQQLEGGLQKLGILPYPEDG